MDLVGDKPMSDRALTAGARRAIEAILTGTLDDVYDKHNRKDLERALSDISEIPPNVKTALLLLPGMWGAVKKEKQCAPN